MRNQVYSNFFQKHLLKFYVWKQNDQFTGANRETQKGARTLIMKSFFETLKKVSKKGEGEGNCDIHYASPKFSSFSYSAFRKFSSLFLFFSLFLSIYLSIFLSLSIYFFPPSHTYFLNLSLSLI